MARKPKVSFIWQGITERKDHWQDGLWAAMKLLEKDFEVIYQEPWEDIKGDVALYWEAPITYQSRENSKHYQKVQNSDVRKALLFAGGEIKREWVFGFDLLFVESQINEDECERMGIPYKRAFGVNTDLFKPLKTKKKYDAIHHGTFASWKRQWLLAEAFKEKGLLVGRKQESDTKPFLESEKHGAKIIEEVSYKEVNKLLNESKCLVQTSDYWGGGQRATLEAMACGLPVMCMSDSPKNREFIEESNCGVVVDPDPNKIREAFKNLEVKNPRDYVMSKWTPKHYADSIREWLVS